MGVPGNLYITTTCVAFLPLDGSLLKTSAAVIMYENLPHHKKGDFMRLADSSGASAADGTDAVVISTSDGNSIFLSDFLSMCVPTLMFQIMFFRYSTPLFLPYTYSLRFSGTR
jgi:hypothetical protein